MATWGGVLVTLAVAIWSLRVARRAERTARQDRNEREAARVSAWVAAVWSNAAPDDLAQKSNVLVIRNASDAAIHDVRASAVMNGRATEFRAAVCPPGESFATWNPPGSRHTWQFLAGCEQLARQDRGISPFTRSDRWRLETLQFTDALGARWEYRSQHGIRPVT
ncbi:hypothetical protein BIU90_10185 [Curtobacterium sp. MCBA15_001]|nr:hypothetical protein BIU90_10185 [Curtobacterium sp. MCBA15_001]